MSIWEAIIQGIVQGVTEFLPVSSSGHLSLAKHVMGIEVTGLFFDVMLHIGTLVAVMIVYRATIWKLILAFFSLCQDIFKGQFKWKEMDDDRRLLMMLIIGLVPLFLLFLPIPGTGMQLKDLSDMLATDTTILAEGFSFLLTSFLLFMAIRASKRVRSSRHMRDSQGRKLVSKGRSKFHVADAISVGLTQLCAALLPGLSRSGSTLSVAMMRGINQQKALDYSFVLGIPSILAAAALTLKDAISSGEAIDVVPLVAGMIASAVVGFLAIQLLKWIVTTNKLHIFAIYTLVLGVVVLLIALIESTTHVNFFSGTLL